jgi:hypothetical protein
MDIDDAIPEGDDVPDDLVPGDERRAHNRQLYFDHVQIRPAYATGMHLNQYLALRRHRHRNVCQRKR